MAALFLVGFAVVIALALGSGRPAEQRFVVTVEHEPETGWGCGTGIVFLLIVLCLLALLGKL